MEKSLRAKVQLTRPSQFLAFGFGSGLSPIMPGTAGSLAAIPVVWAMSFLPMYAYILVTLVSFIVGIKVCQIASDVLGVDDHGAIVWDEIVGMMLVFIAVPITWYSLLIGFVVFRFFDMLKPWPISVLDKNLHGGLGIMLDDIAAGAVTLIIMHALIYFNLLMWPF